MCRMRETDRKEVFETAGRKRKNKAFASKEECEMLIADYFGRFLGESGEVADIESLADHLGTTRDELIFMMNDRRVGQTLRLARNRIAKIKKQMAFHGKIPAAVLSFDLKNNHGYRDKPEDNEGIDNKNGQVVFKGKAADWAQ